MKALIIEDEELIAEELQNKIEAVANDVKIVDILSSLKTAKKWFMQNAEPDLIFMDIQLSDGVSFELFDTYGKIFILITNTHIRSFSLSV